MNKVHVKKGDTVCILSGKDQGKKGKVLSVDSDKRMVVVEGINMATKHIKPKNQYQQGGRINQETPIYADKVMLLCDKCGKATRVGKKFLDNGQKARICKKCGEVIDIIKEAKS